ncbi:rubrerythrin-like domain-containing protein [Natrinema salaciae]|nr:rubrerythrin-like domain-containing protein [Natrinema salaciae]
MSYKDAELDPESESTYECFDCGTVVSTTSPNACPKCGAEMRNRRTPIE